MKKVFLVLAGLLIMVVGFFAMASVNGDIAMTCVFVTCMGTWCTVGDHPQAAVEFSIIMEAICDIINPW